MKTNILFLLIIQLMFITSCELLFPDEKLTLPRTDFSVNGIRTDGYYYNLYNNVLGKRIAIVFLYKNGIVFSAGSYSNLNEAESEMVKYISENRRKKQNWGVFLIEGDRIEYERWERAIGGYNLIIRGHYGNIENDTTIHFTKTYSSETKKTDKIDFVYHFKKFDNKPDSTNNFIK